MTLCVSRKQRVKQRVVWVRFSNGRSCLEYAGQCVSNYWCDVVHNVCPVADFPNNRVIKFADKIGQSLPSGGMHV